MKSNTYDKNNWQIMSKIHHKSSSKPKKEIVGVTQIVALKFNN